MPFSRCCRGISPAWFLVAILTYLLIAREPLLQVPSPVVKSVPRSEPLGTETPETLRNNLFQDYEGSGKDGEFNGAFTLSPEVYGDISDMVPDGTEPATIDELVAERESTSPFDAPPPNLDFIFHNKVPKSGSSTMKHILQFLSKKNGFVLDHVRIVKIGWTDSQRLIQHVKKFRKFHPGYPLVLLKHHTYVNFTNYRYAQPSYINVVRHPVSQFASDYYFKRYGWGFAGEKAEMERKAWHGTEEDRERSVDECVQQKRRECLKAQGVISKYFCGHASFCSPKLHTMLEQDAEKGRLAKHLDWDKISRATELSKKHIARNYHMIGVLEHFDASLQLFEKMMPTIFKGAAEAYQSDYVQKYVSVTKTKVNKRYNNESLAIMENVLRYDMDIYNLCKALFYKQLTHFDISL